MGAGNHIRAGRNSRGVGRGSEQDVAADGAMCAGCTLDRVRTGDEFEVADIHDDEARVQALRFGMGAGASCSCVTKIPAGPIVLRSGRQEIAVGRKLASRIHVRNVTRRGAKALAAVHDARKVG